MVVVIDDLGRPHTRHWAAASRRLLEVPDVLLIGAVRQEDFTAEMVRHGAELVTLGLDADTAKVIAEQLAFEGIELRLEVEEAISKADGLLMEFIALLTTGRRLRDVLGVQAEELMDADNISLDAARLVCAAHTLGVSIPADDLGQELAPKTRAELTLALRRLRDEHIITTTDRTAWRGLHEVRSAALTEILHDDPPPTLAGTLSRVVALLDPHAQGWAIRRAVEQYPSASFDHEKVARSAAARCRSALEFAELFEGFERADQSITAQSYAPVLDRHRRPPITPNAWASFVLGHRLAGISFEHIDVLARTAQVIAACAAELGDLSTALCAAGARNIDSEQLIDAAVDAVLSEAVRLLDSCSIYVTLSERDLVRLASTFPLPAAILQREDRQLYGRLLLAASAAAETHDAFVTAFGSIEDRGTWAAGADPNVVRFQIDRTGSAATVEIMISSGEEGPSHLPWDAARARSDSSDETNDKAVELATFVGECCPEFDVVEVRTLTPAGDPYRIGDLEPGHKRLGREARRPRHETRVIQGLLAALGRRGAANSWTELVRLREGAARDVLATLAEVGRRLNPNDHPGRRARWCDDVERLDTRLAELPRPPVASQLIPGSHAVRWDVETKEDDLVEVLRRIVASLRQVVPKAGGRLVPVGLGSQLGKAADRLSSLLTEQNPLLAGGEVEIYRELVSRLRRSRGLLLAVSFDDSLKHGMKGRPDEFDAVLDRLIDRAGEEQMAADRSTVAELFAEVEQADVHIVDDGCPFVTSINGHQIVVTVPPDCWQAAYDTLARTGQRNDVAPPDVPLSLVCVEAGAVLPIGVRMSKMFASGALPLAPDVVEELTRSLSLPFLPTVHSVVQAVLELLSAASRQIARSRMRPTHWPVGLSDSERLLREAEALIPTEPQSTAVAAPLRRLLDQVRAEERGQASECLAEEMIGLRLLEGAADNPSSVWLDVTEAHLASIEMALPGEL